ncbi:(3R)-3-hydroxyacyl-CoA dehydrogenase-like [Ixodes scapularis]|uniref:(3R)-3-hydroxyacyl-CoA dehydrogenase-like n=1 Tax=Ixodes scapularis TaxID=6945 RepID=UPI001C38B915|nr:(3R)-3-hydroxyacyl-CoA dehydrogenase-like [Ixodes scapularis]
MLNNHKLACFLVLGCLVTGSISNGDIHSRAGDVDVGKPNNDAGTSSLELGGRLALVTGAASGIGRSVAMVLARENVTVIVADINKTGGDQTVDMLPNKHLNHTAMYVDVRNSTSVKDLVECIETTHETNISIVVNSAGILHHITPLVNLSEAIFDDVISTNLKSTFLITRGAVKSMVAQNGSKGAIVNIASINGRDGVSAYAASKGAVLAFTKSLTLELSTKGIRVNAIPPGLTNSFRVCQSPSEVVQNQVVNINPTLSTSKPEEISEKIALILSP